MMIVHIEDIITIEKNKKNTEQNTKENKTEIVYKMGMEAGSINIILDV